MDNNDVNGRLDSSIAEIELDSDIITVTAEDDVTGELAERLDELDLEGQREDDELRLAGRVHAIVASDETLVVRLAEDVLAEGTPVFAEDRRELGSVDHVFGPIAEPMCSLRLQASLAAPSVGARLFYRRDHPRTGIVKLGRGPAPGHDYLVSVQPPARP